MQYVNYFELSSKMFLLLLFAFILDIRANDYIIDNIECKLPYFDAFSEDTNLTYVPLPYKKCSDLDPLTYTTVENNVAYLRINKENLNQYYLTERDIDCCYRYIIRNGTEDEPDIGISASACWNFTSTVRLQEDIVMVKCYVAADLVYENVHHPLIIKKPIREKLQQANHKSKPISVLFIVIDSISRLNFIRTMPQTRNLLLSNGFIEYEGYNKIDDNTFPNFNALLTGLNHAQSHLICKPEQVGMLDKCPMIWYDFRKHGYVTAYAEDWAPISTYNYLKKGFKDPPTDYYFKSYVEAAESLKIHFENTMPYCAGPETEGERILNLAKDFAVTFKSDPNFGIFWMNTFSHNYINSPSRMDAKIRDFFIDIKKHGVLDESIVVLLSDHGIRFGKIRRTIQGWYEERLPMNLISIPEWFQNKYPHKYENLKRNAKKLTSTYDLYMMLQEVLAMSASNYTITNSRACPNCISLFSEIPDYRSCKQAGVPEVWCTCIGQFETMPNNTSSRDIERKASELALRYLIEMGRTISMDITVEEVSLAALTRNSVGKNYMLMIFNTSDRIRYQALFRINHDPIHIVKVIKMIRI